MITPVYLWFTYKTHISNRDFDVTMQNVPILLSILQDVLEMCDEATEEVTMICNKVLNQQREPHDADVFDWIKSFQPFLEDEKYLIGAERWFTSKLGMHPAHFGDDIYSKEFFITISKKFGAK